MATTQGKTSPTDQPNAYGTPPRTTAEGYDSISKLLHWLIVVLVLSQFVVSFLMPDLGPKTVAGTLINLHFSLGMLILAIMAVRSGYRLTHPVALDMRGAAGWEYLSAKITHSAFYLILLIGPFLGWASASAHKLSVNVFGVLVLPALAPPHARWALSAGDVHAVMMWTLLGLIALHAAAALYHHHFKRDDILRRMLPAHRPR